MARQRTITDGALEIMAKACEEAKCCGADHLSMDFVFLGIAPQTGNFATGMLEQLGLDVQGVAQRIRNLWMGKGLGESNLDAEKSHNVIEAVEREALARGDRFIAEHHILLAVAKSEEGEIGVALHKKGITYEVVKNAINAAIEQGHSVCYRPSEAEIARRDWLEKSLTPLIDTWKIAPFDPVSECIERARVCLRKGDFNAAIADYGKAIELNPRNPYPLNERGWLYVWLEQYKEALKDLQAAIALKPDSNFYDSRGWIYFSLGDYDKASADAEEAMRLDPALTWVKALQFRILVARGKREEAVAMAEKTLQDLAPDDLARPVLEYFLGKRTLADLKERFPQNWINYEVAVRGYEPAPR